MPDLKTALRAPDRGDAKSENIQDAYLNHARRDRLPVTLHLMTGATLTGRIHSFDKFSLILESNHQEQLVFKHAVATITLQGRGSANGGTQGPSVNESSNSPSEG